MQEKRYSQNTCQHCAKALVLVLWQSYKNVKEKKHLSYCSQYVCWTGFFAREAATKLNICWTVWPWPTMRQTCLQKPHRKLDPTQEKISLDNTISLVCLTAIQRSIWRHHLRPSQSDRMTRHPHPVSIKCCITISCLVVPICGIWKPVFWMLGLHCHGMAAGLSSAYLAFLQPLHSRWHPSWKIKLLRASFFPKILTVLSLNQNVLPYFLLATWLRQCHRKMLRQSSKVVGCRKIKKKKWTSKKRIKDHNLVTALSCFRF